MDIKSLLDWFEPDELERCEGCGERHGLTIATAGSFICFGCGYIRWEGGVTSVSTIQGGEPSEMHNDLARRAKPSERDNAKQRGIDLIYRSGDTHHLH